MEFTDTEIARFIQQYFLPFARISGLFMAMPVIGTRLVPVRVRLLMALLVTIVVVPLLPPLPAAALSLGTLITLVQEILLGVTIGFAFQIAFQVFVLAGQYMAMKMGLGFASMNDPTNGVQTTVLSQFFLMLVTLMFVSVNGHLLLIELICTSFTTLPPGGALFGQTEMYRIANLGSWLFASALVFALPVLTALLVVNISFGVMSRAAPQLNIFAVGFPFTLICGMFLVWIGLRTMNVHFDNVFASAFNLVHDLLKVP